MSQPANLAALAPFRQKRPTSRARARAPIDARSREADACALAFRLTATVAGIVWLLIACAAWAQEEKPYSVVDGKVDKATFNGYRRYTDSCHALPRPRRVWQLLRAQSRPIRSRRMTYEQFTEVVINGRQNVTGTQKNVMPAFGTVEDVALYIDDIYGYLKARSDGVVGRGRPPRQ